MVQHFLKFDAKVPANVILTMQSGEAILVADFDLAVTATDKTEATGKAGISEVKVFNAGGEKSSSSETTSESRIKFSGPISYANQAEN
jgi:hypothetical protein